MRQEIHYRLALTQVMGIGSLHAKKLLGYFKTAENIFHAKKRHLSMIEGIGDFKAENIKKWSQWHIVDAELSFCEKHKIQILFLTDAHYPQKLSHCDDAPIALYYRGNVDINNFRILSIVGTRMNTIYGKNVTEQLIADLKDKNILIVSGLAFGIDARAHREAIKNNIPTIGVLAHGFKTIYPKEHCKLALDMMQQGGLITEFMSHELIDKYNFPKRNRIVAGMSTATIVIETDVKGGSMITADLAFDYNRDVFAVPGRISDPKSRGCLHLLKQQKAVPFINSDMLLKELGWLSKNEVSKKLQPELFPNLSSEEMLILKLFQD